MRVLRTPDEAFANLPDWPYEPRYVDVDDTEGGSLRVHYVDVGPADGATVVLLHGEPSWGYLYRRLLPVLTAAGLRAVVPDLVGFGRSDKPVLLSDHTYARHVRWMTDVVEALDLTEVTLVGQDWGGLIGLRLVAADPDRYARVVAANTGLPDGSRRLPDAWWQFHDFVMATPDLPIGVLVRSGCRTELPAEVIAAYDAPFPDPEFKAGPRAMPGLIPQTEDNPETPAQRTAWAALQRFDKPFLTAFSDEDPITRGADRPLRERVPGAAGQPHTTITGAGHFLQEDSGPELAAVIVDFIASTN